MLKISEFSKLSHLTIKALRFYEKEGLLRPVSVDEWNNYRFYETSQLETAAKIKSYRQLGLSIEEIKAVFAGADVKTILQEKIISLKKEKHLIESRLSIINSIMEDEEMKYAEQNGYTTAGLARESYIDGIWNKESEEDWLTEIQLPIE